MDELARLLAVSLVCVATISGSEGGCTLYNDDTRKCQAEVICKDSTSNLITTITNWGCGTREEYDCENYYYNNGYYRETNCETRFSHEFQLILNLNAINIDTVSWNEEEKIIENRIKGLVIRNMVNPNIPRRSFAFSNVNEFTMVSNEIESVKLNDFIDLTHLINITLTQNSIQKLESGGAITKSSSVEYIDLSYNLIESIPNNCFSHYSQLKNLNLAHNLIKSFEILSFEGISQLKTLSLSNNRLLEIGQTFARFVNLKELLIDHNNLTSIETINFSTMEKLEMLDLNANQLNNIKNESFENLVRLKSLSLSFNQLSDMRINLQNTALQILDISNNKIEHIASEVFKGKNITEFNMNNNNLSGMIEKSTFDGIYTDVLDLSYYQITSLNSEAFNGLHVRVLNLSSNAINNISSTSFKSVQFLKELDLSNNNLSTINFESSDLKELVQLNLQRNNIEYISGETFKDLASLRKLDLSLNEIKKLEPQIFLGLQKVEFLDLSGNNMSNTLKTHIFQDLLTIASIENETFFGLHALKTLNLSNNAIKHLDFEAFKNTGSIEVLDLSHNLLQQFLLNTSTIISVEVLHLDNNLIRNITNETFFGLINLHKLYLNNNNIIKLQTKSLDFLTNLNVLDLSFNTAMEACDEFHNLMSLTKLSLANIKKQFNFEQIVTSLIVSLDLSSSGIVSLNSIFVYNNKNVKDLTLKANKITIIDKFSFQNMPFLTYLDLSFNMISYIQPGTFLHTNHIKDLNLHGNRLQSIQFGVLDGLNKLDKLNLSSNTLHVFGNNILHNTPTVSVLSLDDNAINEFRFEDFVGTSLKVISIGNNPISCHVFINLKQINHTFVVTAENIDYHSENVDGIKCKSSRANTSFIMPVNVTDVNSTVAFFAFSSALDDFRSSFAEVVKNFSLTIDNMRISSILEQKSASNTIVKILEKVYAVNKNYLNEVSVTNNNTNYHTILIEEYLKNLTKTEIGNVNFTYGNISDKTALDNQFQEKISMLNYEKEKMVNEMQTMFQNLKNSVNTKHDALTKDSNEGSDIKLLLYFIATCLCVFILMCGLFFHSIHKQSRNNFQRHFSSSHPIVNSLELHEH